MKALLIDDNAYQGWQVLLEQSFNIHKLEVATNKTEAEAALGIEHQIIFLDIRLSADEINHNEISAYASYKLIQQIRTDFTHLNFSTPIILFTASNEAWKVKEFIEMGVDAVYTKEHPGSGYNPETSKKNFEALKHDVSRLIALAQKRRHIWNLSREIFRSLENHLYAKKQNKFNKDDNYRFVTARINDKIKLAYRVFFSTEKKYEHDALISNNTNIAFIVYFSMAEEITKLFTKRTQNFKYYHECEWQYRNGAYLIRDISKEGEHTTWEYLKRGIPTKTTGKYPLEAKSLANQMYGLLTSYSTIPSQKKALEASWKEINNIRNNNSFIHSDTAAIYNSPLVVDASKDEDYQSCLHTLQFFLDILHLPVT